MKKKKKVKDYKLTKREKADIKVLQVYSNKLKCGFILSENSRYV